MEIKWCETHYSTCEYMFSKQEIEYLLIEHIKQHDPRFRANPSDCSLHIYNEYGSNNYCRVYMTYQEAIKQQTKEVS